MNWRQHFIVAEGLLEIGLPVEAAGELEKITLSEKGRPEIISLRLQWALAEVCAKYLETAWPDKSAWPIARAACVRRMGDLDAAEAILESAKWLFPEDGHISYQLACIAAVKGDVIKAKAPLVDAIKHKQALQAIVLEERDLQPVWDEMDCTY